MRRLRLARLPAVLAGLAAAVPIAAAVTDCPAEAQGFRRLETADAAVAYRWEPPQLKVGQFFAAEVVACRAPGPEPVGRIAIDATMPAHGHGMNYRPKAEHAGEGRYRFTGLMLHMPGTWRLTFDLFQGARRTRLTEDVRVER